MSVRRLKVVFFGTSEFAVPSLEAIAAAGHALCSVVTQPDRPQGRGRQVVFSPVKQTALHLKLPILQPRRVRAPAFLDEMRALAPDVLALAAFGQIVPQALLELPPLGPINVHGSLLPKYRGAAPIHHAVLEGETVTGVTTMWMDATLDTGDILLAAPLDIAPEETTGTLLPRMAALGAELLLQTLDLLAAGTCPRLPQDAAQATFAPPVQPEDGYIRWEEPAERLRNRVRSMTPRPGALAALHGRKVKVWSTQAVELPAPAGTLPGSVLAVSKSPRGVLVATGDGASVLLTEVQPENGRRMAAADWARGARLDQEVRAL